MNNMKKHLKFLALAPCLFAALCDPIDDGCGIVEPEAYEVNVENISEVYAQNQTIWINSKTSSMLVDPCTSEEEPELITDREVFIDGFFVLKLSDNLIDLNAEVITDVNITYDIGESYNFNSCSEAIHYLPVLTGDSQFYEYRIGISIALPGDYCIVNARDSFYNSEEENNAQIYSPYNILDDRIKFDSCGDTYTRIGTDDFYFFRVE